MQRILKLLSRQKDGASNPRLANLCFTENGLIFTDGFTAIKYGPKLVGSRLMDLVKMHGIYLVHETERFIKLLSLVKNIRKIELDKKENSLVILFSENTGSAIISATAVKKDELNYEAPQVKLSWVDYEKDKEGVFKLDESWRDSEHFFTADGTHIWGDSLGIYSKDNRLISFNWNTYVHTNANDSLKDKEFFVRKDLFELGWKGVEYMELANKNIYFVGPDIQYMVGNPYASELQYSPDLKNTEYYKEFDNAKKYEAKLEFDPNIWKRSKLFAKEKIQFVVEGGKIYLATDAWKEQIGGTDLADCELSAPLSIISLWADRTKNHYIAVAKDSNFDRYYLASESHSGFNFYGLLTEDEVGLDIETGEIDGAEDIKNDETLPF